MPESTDQGRATLHGTQAVASTGFQIGEVPGAAIGEFVVLEMTPDVLRGVELGGIGRELLDLDGALEGFEVLAHERRAMRGQAVPDHEQGFADLASQGIEELDDLRAFDCTRKESEVEAPEGDSGDDRELMPVEVVLQDRVSPRGAQVRTRVGRSLSPDSSMKTMIRPCFAAFFLELASVSASIV